MTKVFTLRVVRPVFQTAVIEVQAWSQNSAVRKALRNASKLSDAEWSNGATLSGDYAAHVEAVIDNQEIYETCPNPHREIREFRAGIGKHATVKYLVLAADMDTGVGRVMPQPWFIGCDPTLQADFCSDWHEPISFVVENDGLDGEQGRAVGAPELQRQDNVIDFPIDEFDEEVADSKF